MSTSWQPPEDDRGPIPFAPPVTDAEVSSGAKRAWLATYGQRLGGWLLDFVLTAFVSALLVSAFGLVHKTTIVGMGSSGVTHTTSWHTTPGGIALAAAIMLAYGGVLIGVWGQTLGMRLTKIKAVNATTGEPAGLGRAFGRAAIELVFYALLLVPWVLDMLWPLWDKQNQTLHDKIAGTVVVNTQVPPPSTVTFA